MMSTRALGADILAPMPRPSIAILFLGLFPFGCGGEDPARRPHVILISVDTLRADHLHCYGYERETSPVIDQLASTGILFEQAHSHSNSTGSSHMSLLTGLLPPTHGIDGHSGALSDSIRTLPQILQRAGYRTAAFLDGGYMIGALGFDRGFDHFESAYELFSHKLDRVESWVAESNDRPTFLFLHTYGVHAPYLPEEEHDVYTNPAYGGPLRERVPWLRDHLEREEGSFLLSQLKFPFWDGVRDFDDADRRFIVDLYDGCIRTVDAGVGRLLDALERKGWLENAWVIVLSDHGEAFWEHGSFGHRGLYEEELHVPLILHPPGGLEVPRRIAELAGLVDLVPTLLAALEVDAPMETQGRDLLMESESSSAPIHSYAVESPNKSVLTERYKLMRLESARTVDRLYHVAVDPEEHNDLLSDGAPQMGDTSGEAYVRLKRELEESLSLASELQETLGKPQPVRELTAGETALLRALGYTR